MYHSEVQEYGQIMDFVHKKHSLIGEKIFAAPSSKHSKHFFQCKLLRYCVNQGLSNLFSLILVFEESISISNHGQYQVQRQLPDSKTINHQANP